MHWGTLQRSTLLNVPAWPTYIRSALTHNPAAIAPWIAAGISLLLFVSTMAPDLTWRNHGGDGGELIAASMTLGIPYPPGYPLYTLIGRLFGAIPLGHIAARYNFLSAFAAALAVGLATWLMTIRSNRSRMNSTSAVAMSSVAIGLALALTPLFWGQAVITEVYTLHLVFVAAFLWAILTGRSPFVVGLTFGLATTSHLTGLLLLPLALWQTHRSGLTRFGLGTALGLSPLLLLPLLSASGSPVTWGDVDTVGGWWWLVSARLYRPNVVGFPIDQLSGRLAEWLTPGILLPALLWLALAAVAVWRRRRDTSKVPIIMLVTALLYFLYAFSYRTQDAAVLLLPGIILTTIIVGRWLVRFDSVTIWLLPAALLMMATVSFQDTSEDTLRDRAVIALSDVPANAIVLAPGDATISALWYLHHVEGMRPDIFVIDGNMFQFDWYRAQTRSTHPEIWVPDEDDLELFVAENRRWRPVCHLSLTDGGQPACMSPDLEASVE